MASANLDLVRSFYAVSVIHGGKPLGRAPADSGEGWTSSAFAEWLK